MQTRRVQVSADDLGNGILRPVNIIWDEDHVYHVDEVIKVIRSEEYDWGKYATAYMIRIGSHETWLYRDRDGWFVQPR